MAKAKTKADRIRDMRAKEWTVERIARRMGVAQQSVRAQFWADDNRERVREHARNWQRRARENPSYCALELEVMRERYRDDPKRRESVKASNKRFLERNPNYYREWYAARKQRQAGADA